VDYYNSLCYSSAAVHCGSPLLHDKVKPSPNNTVGYQSTQLVHKDRQTDTQMDTQTDLPHPFPDGIRAL